MSVSRSSRVEPQPQTRGSPKQVSRVLEVAPAASSVAFAHFSKRLEFETDCADVHSSLASGAADFVLLDVRGRQAYSKGHVARAINIPLLTITAERMMVFPGWNGIRGLLCRTALQRLDQGRHPS